MISDTKDARYHYRAYLSDTIKFEYDESGNLTNETMNLMYTLGFHRNQGLELATRRELPHMITGSNILEANPTYGIEIPTEREIEDIPKIQRSQITLTNFIGKKDEIWNSRNLNESNIFVQGQELLDKSMKVAPRD